MGGEGRGRRGKRDGWGVEGEKEGGIKGDLETAFLKRISGERKRYLVSSENEPLYISSTQ